MNPTQLLNPKAFAKDAASKKRKTKAPAPRPKTPPSPTTPKRADKKTTSSNDTSPVTPKTFDPRILLSRGNQLHKAKATPDFKDIQSPTAPDSGPQANGGFTHESLLDRLHNTGKREAAPMKRAKKVDESDMEGDDEHQKKKSKFDAGGRGSGPIGDAVREMRQKAVDEDGPPTGIVDLTNDDQEDDVVITGAVSTDDRDPTREVCIGSFDVVINAHRVPLVSNKNLERVKDMWPPSKVAVRRTPGLADRCIDVLDRNGSEFGRIDFRAAIALAPLLNIGPMHKFRMSGWLLPRKKDEGEEVGDSTSKPMSCRLTCFCKYESVHVVGLALSKKSLWLNDPIAPEGKEIHNPHAPKDHVPKKVSAVLRGMAKVSGEGYSRTTEEIQRDVKGVIDNLPNSEGLPFADANTAIVKTGLLDHQKQALYWLSSKESPADARTETDHYMWKPNNNTRDRSDSWYNVITGTIVKKIPERLGGLFCDDMGLGKTLSILSRIAATIDDAAAFGESSLSTEMLEHEFVERNTKATLIVCPKSVLSNWDEQIKAHLDGSRVSYYIYHGPKRTQDLDELAKYDIVITSYSIVNSDIRNAARTGATYTALAKLSWYRVVLDEAHQIRNMQTGNFASCCALATARRWAVTGTPVQNRLDDLGALIRFARIEPFSDKGVWEMHFLAKFKSGDEQVLPNLKLLVSDIMLRRSKKGLHMSEPTVRIEELDFTAEEFGLYEAFAKDSGIKLNAILSSSGLRGKGTAHMLTFITRLRMICCHGKELLTEDDLKLLDGKTIGTAIDLGEEFDERPVLSDYQIYNTFCLMRDSNANLCEECGKEIGKDDEDPAEDEVSDSDDEDEAAKDKTIGYMTPCYHLICTSCHPRFITKLERTRTSDGYADCPSCAQYIRCSICPVTKLGLAAEEERRSEIKANPSKAKNKGQYSGPHSKVRALLRALNANFEESMRLPADSPPIRSVVFSGWTQYLDLISLALTDNNIPHLRLDGKMSVSARSIVMEQFRTDPRFTVMLVSIRAGGQGLNFTAANKVYMMEPQFNPGVEQQAVDRVHRLGQTREVEIVRYVMRDSFEGKILELQEAKKRLAREAFGEGGKENAAERLKGLRALFR